MTPRKAPPVQHFHGFEPKRSSHPKTLQHKSLASDSGENNSRSGAIFGGAILFRISTDGGVE
jgi:hypothetical protein